MSANSVAVVALDLHKKFTRAVTMDPGGKVMDDRRVHHADHSEMEGFFREFERGTDVVMEATFNWPWIAVHIKEVERALKLDLEDNDDARIVDSLPGFGMITSHGFLAEVGELDRFPNGRALAAYAGVLPLDNESADKDLGKHTGKHSNRFLRWILLEAVNGAVKKSPRMRSLLERVKARNRKQPGKARVAVARELAELAHLLLSRRVLCTESPPPRPGSRVNSKDRTTRPGSRVEGKHRTTRSGSDKASRRTKTSERPRKSFPLTGKKLVRPKGRRQASSAKE